MRRPRRRRPDHLVEVTVRCSRSEMRLVPTLERVDILGFWLAKAMARSPGVQLLAICQMSNHLHLVLRDRRGELSAFMQYFLGHLAKRINRLDRIRGAVFERRFAEISIVDDEALLRRVAYAVCNPVEANLVRSPAHWSGLCTFVGAEPQVRTFTVFQEGRFERARAEAARRGDGAEIKVEDYYETASLELPSVEKDLAGLIAAAVEARAVELRKGQRSVLGMAKVLAASPFTRPKWSSRSAMPLCFASTKDARRAFVAGWRTFVDAFRAASVDFRSGNLGALFPSNSFRPSTPATG